MSITKDDLIVLIAEHDENNLLVLRRILEKYRANAAQLEVSSGQQAFAYLNRQPPYSDRIQYPFPDVLILEHQLPDTNGLEVLERLRAQSRFDRLPIVLLNVFSPAQERGAARLNAACCCMGQDGDGARLLEAVSSALLGAFRLASLIPDAAWYRSTDPPAISLSKVGLAS